MPQDQGWLNKHRARNIGEGAISGAATGAGIGAAIGSIGGPIGTGVGAAIGGGAGFLWGLLSSTEQQELEEMYSKGMVSSEQEDMIADMLADRYRQHRTSIHNDMARRGLGNSTIASRAVSQAYGGERDAFLQAMQRQSMDNRDMGMDMIAERNRQSAARGKAALDTFGGLAQQHYQDKQNTEYMDWAERVFGGQGSQRRTKPISPFIPGAQPTPTGDRANRGMPSLQSPIMNSSLNRRGNATIPIGMSEYMKMRPSYAGGDPMNRSAPTGSGGIRGKRY